MKRKINVIIGVNQMNKSTDCVDYVKCRVFNLCRRKEELCKDIYNWLYFYYREYEGINYIEIYMSDHK
jgi:hypothetical protein